jgi:hypothetical protein
VPGEQNNLGVFSGVYAPGCPSLIDWTDQPEFQQEGKEERVMGFAECNGRLYCSTSSKIYERTDGPAPAWTLILDVRAEKYGLNYIPDDHMMSEDMRALTALHDADLGREVLLFGWLCKIVRLDPVTGAQEIEADVLDVLGQAVGVPVGYAQLNENSPFGDGSLLGVEFILMDELEPVLQGSYQLEFANAVYDYRGFYLVRQEQGGTVSYTAREITADNAPDPEVLLRVRATVTSPFPEDAGNAVYAAGFSNRTSAYTVKEQISNTAWIYRGLRVEASHGSP